MEGAPTGAHRRRLHAQSRGPVLWQTSVVRPTADRPPAWAGVGDAFQFDRGRVPLALHSTALYADVFLPPGRLVIRVCRLTLEVAEARAVDAHDRPPVSTVNLHQYAKRLFGRQGDQTIGL